MRRLTKEEFVAKSVAVHGDKYGYDKVVYVNNRTPVLIYCVHCKKYFKQTPNDHLKGKGCRDCGFLSTISHHKHLPSINNRKIKYGVGINDYDGSIIEDNGDTIQSYRTWHSMLCRCYSDTFQSKEASYNGCTVCDEWKLFSNFKKWFDDPSNGYKKGYELDKDILIKGNKVYSPYTCLFIPKRINSLLLKPFKYRKDLPIGVSKHKKRFAATCACAGGKSYIGLYKTPLEAFNAYKEVKENYIKSVAEEYFSKDAITEKAYRALLNYKIEITD